MGSCFSFRDGSNVLQANLDLTLVKSQCEGFRGAQIDQGEEGLIKSGRRLIVVASAVSFRHSAIALWFPESRTSGTFHPLYSEGRVKWG